MIGSNKFVFNEATLIQAVQEHFNRIFAPGQAPEVKSVDYRNGEFDIETVLPESPSK